MRSTSKSGVVLNVTYKIYTIHMSNRKENKEDFIQWTTRAEELLHFFGSHKAAGIFRDNAFLDKSLNFCSELFAKDGDIEIINNYGTKYLCGSYPIRLIVRKSFLHHIQQTDDNLLSRLLERARYARVHRRFVMPVIFLPNNTCIARSSTLSTTGEILLNKASNVVSDVLLSS